MTSLALVWGLIGSVAFTSVVLASWWRNPEVWLADVTNGEQRPEANAAAVIWTALVALAFLGGGFVAAWLAASGDGADFVERFLVAYAVMAIVNLVDLVVVDIAVYLWLRPSWMTIPGVEMPTDYGMHVRGAVNGFAMAIPIALVAAVVGFAA
ncbi:MAG: hypothetical protein AAGA93_08950 [Actinomycetota bacterium]